MDPIANGGGKSTSLLLALREQMQLVNGPMNISEMNTEQAANDRATEIVSLLLPVLDNFERALATDTADKAYAEGVRLTYRHLLRVLEGLGVQASLRWEKFSARTSTKLPAES
jgi:molecular chaperone GrpE (heat shock protein)